MSDRKRLVSTLWLASSLILLASMLLAPGPGEVSSQPGGLRRDLAPSPGQPTALIGAAMATDAVPRVNALPSEDEERERADSLDEPRLSFLILWSFRQAPDRQPIANRSIPSLYPLRC